MFRNYLITALRNFSRNKIFSGITILGLSIGISAALVLFLIVNHELSYDRFEPGRDRIYRVVLDARFNGTEGHAAAVPAPLGEALQKEVTGLEQTAPVFTFQGDATANVSIKKPENDVPVVFKKQPDIIFTNHQYFYIVPHRWIAGSPATSLKEPFSVVLTEGRAAVYFPSLPVSDIIGREITYNENLSVRVSGIVEDINQNTDFNAREFISYPTIAETSLQNNFMMDVWNDWMAYSSLFVKLNKGQDADGVESQINTMYAKYNPNAHQDDANWIQFRLQPLADVHFDGLYTSFGLRVAHKPTLYGLAVIAAFLLLLGCINFINLTTANAAQRAKEIGIRKTMGSNRGQLVLRFLGETFLITLVATILSAMLAPVLLRIFRDFTPPGLDFNLWAHPSILVFLLILTLVVSVLAGIYPALILSGFRPVFVLRNQRSSNRSETRHTWIRKTLTVSQFVIAQFFVIATLMVSKQIHYSLNADLGFRKDGIVKFDLPRKATSDESARFIQQIRMIPGVQQVSAGFMPPSDVGAAYTNVTYPPQPDIQANIQFRWGDPQFLDVYQLRLVAGRNVFPSDTLREVLINETYARLMGFRDPGKAVGEQLEFFGKKRVPIVGVIRDFHDLSMHVPISPLVYAGQRGSTLHVLMAPANGNTEAWQKIIAGMQQLYKRSFPESDFNLSFYDDTLAKLYFRETRTATLLIWATGLTVLISCLGLLGLVIFTIHTRNKEIGIRKILGASIGHLVARLSADFLKWVAIAVFIAAPIAWWAVDRWLQDFAYRTRMSWWVFALSGFAMLFVSFLTLSFQTIRAAIRNPVKALRTE